MLAFLYGPPGFTVHPGTPTGSQEVMVLDPRRGVA